MSSFTIRPFAFMRLTHEAFRAGLSDLQRAAAAFAAAPTAVAAAEVRRHLDALDSCIAVHADIEERAFFPLLDARFDGAASAAGFLGEHDRDERDRAAVRVALAAAAEAPGADTAATLLARIDTWAEGVEAHLVHEEDVMMPLTQRVAPTLEGRAAAVGELIRAVPEGDVRDRLVPYVLRQLEATKPLGPVRMFVESLKVSLGDEGFAPYAATARRELSSGAVAKLEAAGTL